MKGDRRRGEVSMKVKVTRLQNRGGLGGVPKTGKYKGDN